MKRRHLVLGLLFSSLLLLASSLDLSANSRVRIVRLSWVEGEVYLEQPGVAERTRGIANLPLVQEMALETANGFAEVEFESDAVARLATETRLELNELTLLDSGGRVSTLTLPQGTATFSAELRREDAFLILTPYFQVSVSRRARFRVDVTPSEASVRVFEGEVNLDGRAGALRLTRGRMFEWYENRKEYLLARNPERDGWDQWNEERDRSYEAAGNYQVIPATLRYGAYDLNHHGRWTFLAGFGNVWRPWVTVGWSPFVSGRWVWYPQFGWVWASFEPWGWLPYHYGSWHYDGFWGWVWVPGYFNTWSPARCYWIHQPGWIGWAPRQPAQGGVTGGGTREDPARLPRGTVIVSERGFERGDSPRRVEEVREASGGRWQFAAGPPAEVTESLRQPANVDRMRRPIEGIEFDEGERRYVNRRGATPVPLDRPGRRDVTGADERDRPQPEERVRRLPRPAVGDQPDQGDVRRPGSAARPAAPARRVREPDSDDSAGVSRRRSAPTEVARPRPSSPRREFSPRPVPRTSDSPRPAPAPRPSAAPPARQPTPSRPATSAPASRPSPPPRETSRPAPAPRPAERPAQ